MKKYLREPINALTHLIGAGAFVIGLAVLITIWLIYSEVTLKGFIAITVFGISLIALYLSSGIFHLVIGNKSLIRKLRKLDHSMIYILIAGTYTPFCLLVLEGAWSWSLLILIWSFALVGIFLSIFYINMPRLLSTSLYIIMGWLAVIAFYPLYHSLEARGLFYLVLGGVIYTVGGVIYGIKKPNISKRFGFHELFHIFVLLGSITHYWAVLKYVIL